MDTEFVAQPGAFGRREGGDRGLLVGLIGGREAEPAPADDTDAKVFGAPWRVFQGVRERRRAGFAGVGRGGVASTGSSPCVPGMKKSQRFGCTGEPCGSGRGGSGFLARPVGFSGIKGTRGLRGMPG